MKDLPGLYVAIAQWLVCMLHIVFFPKRKGMALFVPLSLLWLGVIVAQQQFLGYAPPHRVLWPTNIVCSLLIMIFFMFSCARIKLSEAVFYGISSFITVEFMASVEWQLYYYFSGFDFAQETWFKYLWLALIYTICCVLLAVINFRLLKREKLLNVTVKDIAMFFLIFLVSVVSANIKFFFDTDNWSSNSIEQVFELRTLSYLCGMFMLCIYRGMLGIVFYKSELIAVENVMKNQYLQYQKYKENDELINRHYHDLKHQLDIILNEKDVEKRAEYLREMQSAIKVRQSENKTGNEVIDVVLSAKSLECIKYGITFTVVADGKLLDFMSKMDLCAVLGNCIDNAIEYVKNIEDKEKRMIHFALFAQGDCVVFRVKNYFNGKLNFEGNNIVTTKENKSDHGYGLKSIRLVTKKYGGNMKIITENGWFVLCLLFPQGGKISP